MSFIKFGYYAFFHGTHDGEVKDANRGQSVAMVVVAALCVLYGVYDAALFAILPVDVTAESLAHPYTTYTVDHVVEGVVLAVLGLIGFYATKKPLSKLGRVPDLDRLYNPAVFYGARVVVLGTTRLYGAVDRVVVRAATTATTVATHPERVAARVTADGAREDGPVTLRAGIGFSILVLAVFVTVGMVLLF
jgi:multicomponent Na+:H+ antiporter subunit D